MSTAPTVEPFCVSDTFVTGAGPLQFMGDNLRLTLFVSQRSYDGSPENAVVTKLVGSRSDMLKIAEVIVRGCYTIPGKAERDGQRIFLEILEAPAERH
ncbi:MAG: hypothetical protein EOR30_17250 [Mesorhizobium sp.]|uniref:hypothetical protein n=2 Tax=unclassified Mesorhizobium TaxID=325217 RepID=UPI000FE2DC23|nr:hypothetical protein [Mesorhizobium sp.]RWF54588.1 MAG: hypothetical protein EOS50_16960 [Mesorhizobium sp.]RWF85604.1 MAG: hypothetical protein EOQ36_21625 [Mesorhizobium sp.]RWF95317.1 MAG: hypothetical protein EOQ45_08315 [Mesorhizobium sp.]RWI39848.1 MAG: hypothetical protein EOR14_17335 [Mesorhizobium sp.]RWI45286.1 MAG: hypothetical protein EOR15_22705 [Mesorhizobium sp.]